jgi:hypothetical protein
MCRDNVTIAKDPNAVSEAMMELEKSLKELEDLMI